MVMMVSLSSQVVKASYEIKCKKKETSAERQKQPTVTVVRVAIIIIDKIFN